MNSVKKVRNSKFLVCLLCCTFLLTQVIVLFMPAKKVLAATQYIRIKNVWQQNYLYEDNNQVKYGNVGADNQYSQWLIEDSGDGYVKIKNRASGEYINIETITKLCRMYSHRLFMG